MTRIDRRRLLGMAAALGASAAWSTGRAAPSARTWRERRDLYPEGVASGDPQETSVILWTRRPPQAGEAAPGLTVEVAEDEAFARVVATAPAKVSAASDWTTRVLVGGLKPRRVYWYRFVDAAGNGSRVGRTITAPAARDDATVRFAFVSCQNANQGAMNAYRRMIWEDEKKPADQRLDFVCHLGDFIYEIVWYPEDRPKGYYDRRLRDIVRYANGQKISDFHIPTTLDDYRAVYRGYLHDPDLQDARARFPFVAMWDNHEFSWRGYQGVQKFGDQVVWAQDRKVFANQAWFEFQPARVKHAGTLETFVAPKVTNGPIGPVDDHGLGQAPSNLAAINSLIGYRALRFGKNMELILTDHHSYKMDEPTDRPEAEAFDVQGFPLVAPEEINDVLDAGRAFPGGAPATIPLGGKQVANYRKDEPPFSVLGATQKAWLKRTLNASTATWKVWGCTNGALDLRADPQNLPAGLGPPWPGAGYGNGGGGDFSGAVTERAELYDFVRDQQITGFSIVSGDRHSFWAGLAAKALPPKAFEPVGVAFITGSISAPGFVESAEYGLKKDGPLRALYLRDVPGQKPEPTVNMLLKHGVRSCLEYARTGDVVAARKLSNPQLSPHLSFVDMSGHGYAAVTVSGTAMETEFVAIQRPLERSATADGGPLAYRVTHRAPLWRKGERPRLEQRVIEGDPKLSI
jgi:alkaline phosphatase D